MPDKIYDFEKVYEYFKTKRPDFKKEILEPLKWSLENKIIAFRPAIMFIFGEKYLDSSCEDRVRQEQDYQLFRNKLRSFLESK